MIDIDEKRKSIRDLMEYAVPEEQMNEAEDLLEIYRNDLIALQLLHEFYSFPPEGRNDFIREIQQIQRRQGVFLLAAVTPLERYLYLVSSEGVEFHGHVAEGLWDQEVLDFFEYESRESFIAQCGPEQLQVYEPLDIDLETCPACHAASGELHELGCPVELCPWCGGQLIYCSCRYDKLGVELIGDEQELARFEEILHEQGRIPYSPEQRPSFPDEGPDVIIE